MFKFRFTQLFGNGESYDVTGSTMDEVYLNARKAFGSGIKSQHLYDENMYHMEEIKDSAPCKVLKTE